MQFDSAPQHENTHEKPASAPVVPVKKENIFLKRESDTAQEFAKLRHELAQLTQKIGTITEQIRNKVYPGKLGDKTILINERDTLVQQMQAPKFAQYATKEFAEITIKDNFTGRDARADRKNN